MPITRGYSSGKFALELQGKPAGFLRSVEGGEPYGTVAEVPGAADAIVDKHIAHVEYEKIVITFGVGMADELYGWIRDTLDRKQDPRDGAVKFLNYDFTETQRLEWKNGLITAIAFPRADAGAREEAFLTVTIAPESTAIKPSSGKSVSGFSTRAAKKWIASNFRFSITGLEDASSKVKRVERLSISQPVVSAEEVRQPGQLQISNTLVTVPLSFAQPWLEWAEDFLVKGNSGNDDERTATLEFLDQTLKTSLFTLTLYQVGLVRAKRQFVDGTVDVVAEVEIELYCESIGLAVDKAATGSTASAQSTGRATNAPLNQPTAGSAGAVTDAILTLLAAAGSGTDTARAARALQAGSLTRNPELVARRLKAASVHRAAPASAQRKRSDGELVGERWATEDASLEELQAIAPLETRDWTAIRLDSDHSLIARLRDLGLVPAGGEGGLQLTRDEFVEGLVAGAARVFRAALPHLNES